MSTISFDDVKKLARLSALDLDEQQAESMRSELESILDYIEQLQAAETNTVEPTYQVNGLESVTREDVLVDYGVSQEELLKNAPERRDGMIVVPRVLE